MCLGKQFFSVIGCSNGAINLLWVPSWQTWSQATQYCSSRGLTLFDLLNGDLEIGLLQNLPNFIDRFTFYIYITGVRKYDGVWKSQSGRNVTEFIKWKPTQPNNNNGETYFCIDITSFYSNDGLYGHDSYSNGKAYFFCYEWEHNNTNAANT